MARSRSASSRTFGPRTSPRRKTAWDNGPGANTLLGITSSTAGIVGSGSEVLQDGVTLVRTRGYFNIVQTLGDASLAGYTGAIGLGLVGKPAFTAGVGSVPTPITEADWEGWIWHQLFDLRVPVAAAVGTVVDNLRFEIDAKAMRKTGLQEVFYFAIEVTEVANAAITVRAGSRMLFKLP